MTPGSTVTVLVVENKRQSVVDGLTRSRGLPQEYVFTIVDTFNRIQLLCFQREISLSNTTKSEHERFIEVLAFTCHVRGISPRRTCPTMFYIPLVLVTCVPQYHVRIDTRLFSLLFHFSSGRGEKRGLR